ncbi:MAG: 2-octaprenyl-6-methoxyphenyl hydroxylase [Gammaproteobacteria bacterium]|jgi:2-polyprenyl-6-methoxyphenol 4-hydroxylase|nr:2-octaprenyl-6-methoxyphenyl hydroxylase [Gammaproteobacteria bacterium]MBT3860102.1 2-octaprenyl-6-methoxyphenyl hydroxylase [Gammaproteobacteria bacterium]MBT3987394.1 2-octaprenyl-6-methoxyphenyl hydroxylase [Gammaproteobacteria bacterium]MBT4256545.1 2-octaprenyl-6-methoxyphenyl hydroxylase [Gammaproteobacteria bacterium]MBT4581868.1 2-octaprenyl-6-methoxyphenyl hydroxylase [Gammaproteobacteria bacterium]
MNVEKLKQHYDLVVVGGGMVGASFACALTKAIKEGEAAGNDFTILVVEAVAPKSDIPLQQSFDARSTALSYGSSKIFQTMGLWNQLKSVVSAIEKIHVSDKGRLGSSQLNCEDYGVDALGYVIENSKLGVVLNDVMEKSSSIELACPAKISQIKPQQEGMSLQLETESGSHQLDASLVVLADGGRSPICSQLGISHSVEPYGQHALIANIAFEKPHEGTAYERFTDTGPLAVLPLESIEQAEGVGALNRGSLVWTLSPAQAAEYKTMEEAELRRLLQERFGNRLGTIQHIGERFIYPLSLSLSKEQVRPGLVLLGNVAHAIHPVAGQGLNLALRDTKVLVEVLTQAIVNNKAVGEMSVLQEYLQRQQADQSRTISFTHYMTQLFSSNNSAKVLFRKFGLFAIDLIPGFRKSLAEQAMGLSK